MIERLKTLIEQQRKHSPLDHSYIIPLGELEKLLEVVECAKEVDEATTSGESPTSVERINFAFIHLAVALEELENK